MENHDFPFYENDSIERLEFMGALNRAVLANEALVGILGKETADDSEDIYRAALEAYAQCYYQC